MRLGKKNIDKSEIILHSLFWITWIFSFTILQSLGEGWNIFFNWLIYYVVTLPVFIVHTYLIAYWLIPKFIYRGKYLVFILGLISFLIFFSILELVVSNELVFKPLRFESVITPHYLNFKNIIISGSGNHYIILVFLAIKIGRSWYFSENRKEELVQWKTETELEIYRYQLQPRLILTLVEELEMISSKDPQKVPQMIINISGFLNRFLFEGSAELVPLQVEIKLIEEFLEIHKPIICDRFSSGFQTDIHNKSLFVPPFILMPFLNDVIKLGYNCNEGENSFKSKILIKSEKKRLSFSFKLQSEKDFHLTHKRLNYNFPGKYRINEYNDKTFSEISIEIYY